LRRAQRRYRRRRQEKIQSLEEEARRAKTLPSLPSPSSSEATPSPAADDDTEAATPHSDIDNAAPLVTNSSLESIPTYSTDLSVLGLASSFSFSIFDQMTAAPTSSAGFGGSSLTSLNTPDSLTGSIDTNSVFINPDFLQAMPGFDIGINPSFMTPVDCFTDDMILDLPALKLMNVGHDIAEMLGVSELVFDPTITHVLAPMDHLDIPSWLKPTKYQQLIPHHPIIDLLPWPSVRNRLICGFVQPMHRRPPSAREPFPAIPLMSDMDDEQEGLRIVGSEGFKGEAWEVGQAVFNNWWWAFEPAIIKNTNRLREKRGAGRLLLPGSSGERS
jgi:hypothetical protein